MLIVPSDFRAPLFVPGRRDRRVRWNRPLSRAIAMLGRFEREDYYRGSIRPWSLRQFFPAWNNQFSPGGGSDCGCCDGGDIPCSDVVDCFGGSFPSELFVTIPNAYGSGTLGCSGGTADCADIAGTYSVPFSSSAPTSVGYETTSPHYFICSSGLGDIVLHIQLLVRCSSDICVIEFVNLRVGVALGPVVTYGDFTLEGA